MTDTLSLLKLRRSVPPQFLTAPGPDGAQLDELLAIAARVPDHGKLDMEGEAKAWLESQCKPL